MARLARITAPGLIYHVTQRGNRGNPVFFDPEDRVLYQRWFRLAAGRYGLEIWNFCLMTNHVHFLVRGAASNSLARTMRRVQGAYARHVNESRKWSGHLWSGRFFSTPVGLDAVHVVARYIETNPVRAGMVFDPCRYEWSSARANCGLSETGILAPDRPFRDPSLWRRWLDVRDGGMEDSIRRCTRTGRPIGGDDYCRELELLTGRPVLPRRGGRPPLARP